jgi:hypothetical protein
MILTQGEQALRWTRRNGELLGLGHAQNLVRIARDELAGWMAELRHLLFARQDTGIRTSPDRARDS